ncbi:MAG: hypothetical protein V4662_12720 [Verrucomicrobiota bacterium]
MKASHLALVIAICAHSVFAQEAPVDMQKAREIFERAKRGEAVTPEERAYVDRAQREMRNRNQPPPPEPWTQHLTPLTELGTGQYKGEDGGLYGGGKNEPPASQLAAAMKASEQVTPLDAEGKLSADGKIGLMSAGMSNTTQEFSTWRDRMKSDREISPKVAIVDCAQGARTSIRWADASSDVWPEVDKRLKAAGVSEKQIQVIWLKLAEGGPRYLGEFPKHAQVLKDNTAKALTNLHAKFPNLKLVYLSSRIYAGYANTHLNPEPYAYESAFSMRWLIQDQIAGKAEIKSLPVLLWGPYLWADGDTPRKADGLVYKPEDLGQDGTHPSRTGQVKVADLLTTFFKGDATTKSWFLAK